MVKIELYNDDCLKAMKNIPDNSVDMILTDPPFGTTECVWDHIIPFEQMWSEVNRIIKTKGCIALFGSEPFSSALRMSNMKMYKYDWIWIKNTHTNFVHAKNKPMKKHEIISIFSKGTTVHKTQSINRMDYYPQGLIKCNKLVNGKTKNSNISFGKRKSHKDKYIRSYTNYPHSCLFYDVDNNCKKRFHPTQKPIKLLEYLIKTYTLENQTVLDFTMGSGSTGVACKHLNRNFIGIELDEKYFKIAEKRIKEAEIICEKKAEIIW